DVNKSLVKIEDELYEVDFDYNGNSVGVQFAIPVPVVKVEVKHFDDLITPLVHRISKDALSVHTSLDNINFKTLDRSKWEFSLDGFGNIVITFDEPIETRYLKIHSQFEDRDENDEIINLSQFKNLLKDMVHVYQMSEEGILEYDYDSVGNRTEKKRFLDSGTDEIKYYYDSGNGKGNGRRLLYETAIGVDGVERNLYGYRYDENGNLVEKSNRFMVKATGDVELIISAVGVEYWKYAYDVQNRLVKIEKNREVIAEYGYDVDGMRVLSKINDKRTRYIYNFVGNVVYEEDDEKARSYIYGHGKIIAEVKGTVGSSGEVYYYHHDNLGSTRLITDSDGQVMMDQDYLPFGDDLNRPGMLESVSSYETGYKYTGQHQEVEIGLYYYGARFYDQRVGRFVSEDSYLGRLDNSLSQHLYIYVLQNPMKYVDPTGNYATVDIDGPTKDLGNGITSHLSDDDIKMLNKEFEEIYGFFERRSMIKEFKKLKVSNKTHIENEVKIMKDLFVKGIISWRAYFVVMKNLVGDDFDKCILSLEQNIAMSNKILYNGMTEEEIWDQYNFMYFDPPTSSSGVDWEVVGNGLVTFFSGGGQLVTGIGLIATPDVTVTKVVGAYTIIHGGSNMAQGFKTIINGFEGKGIAPNYLQESYIWLSSKAFEKTLGKGSEGIGRAAGALLFRSVDIAICVYGTQDAIKTLSKSKQLENGAFFVRNTKFKIFEKLSFFPSYYPAQFQLTTSRIGAINDIHSYFSGGISLYEEINSFQMYSQKED
ncbi:MAG: DUF4225 domain-containing protein, partial [Halanaerobiales bacterium]|nr:DUF4225 domain-containing protein [Halanaerobiales bacterium]